MRKQDAGYGIQDTGACDKVRSRVSHPASGILDPDSLERVRWRCRRGLLELDIVLGRFIEAQYMQLSEKEKQVFEELLDMPDNPLWDMISGKQDLTQKEQQALLEKIKSV